MSVAREFKFQVGFKMHILQLGRTRNLAFKVSCFSSSFLRHIFVFPGVLGTNIHVL